MNDFATRYQPACLTCAERAEAEAMRMDAEAAAEARQESHAARADRLHRALSRLRKLRAEAKARGLCGECRARPTKQGRATCAVCLDKHRERDSAYRAVGLCECGRDPGVFAACKLCREAHRLRSQRQYKQRKQAGLCTHRGCRAAAVADRTMCMKHLASSSVAVNARKRSFIEIGICGRCQREPLTSETMCAACLQEIRDYARRVAVTGRTRRNFKHSEARR